MNCIHICIDCDQSHVLLVYLVWCEAVQRSDWSRVWTLQLTQIGQERQISLLITTLVFPVKCSDMRCSQESGIMFLHQYINNGGALTLFLDSQLLETLLVY